jgi:hypothetical protein
MCENDALIGGKCVSRQKSERDTSFDCMPSIKPQTEHKKRLKLSNFMHSNGAIFQNNLIFAWYGHDKQVTQQYAGRIHLIDSQIGVGKASINLTSVSDLNDDFS